MSLSPDKEAILAELVNTPRVWSNLSGENATQGLIQLCQEWIKPNMIVVEVGSFSGVSTCIFASFARIVFAVDAWTLLINTPYSEVSHEMLIKAEIDFFNRTRRFSNICPIKGFSEEVSFWFNAGFLDAVYIDGEHSVQSFSKDVLTWRPKLKSGGLLMGHDFNLVGHNFSSLDIKDPISHYSETSWVKKID